MKNLKWKLLFAVLMSFSVISATAQNVQLHFDLVRNATTTTVEMFRPDKGGSTFFFVDMDYTPKVSGAYWEIAREFCFWQESERLVGSRCTWSITVVSTPLQALSTTPSSVV